MATSEPKSQPPIVAAFSPDSARTEPVEFAWAASRLTGAPLVVAVVRVGGALDDVGMSVDDVPQDPTGPVEHLRDGMRRRGIGDPDVMVKAARSVKVGLEHFLEELKPQLIVLGTNRRGAVGSALVGATVEHVIHAATCPGAVVPDGYKRADGGVQIVGAAFAPTSEGRAALAAAASLARTGGVRLRAITVLDPKHAGDQAPGLLAAQHHETGRGQEAEAAERLEEVAELRRALAGVADGVEAEVDTLFNDPAEGLVAASRHVDLLVMGSRGRGARAAAVLGSVSREVAERAACPVVILPARATETSDGLLAHAAAHAPQ